MSQSYSCHSLTSEERMSLRRSDRQAYVFRLAESSLAGLSKDQKHADAIPNIRCINIYAPVIRLLKYISVISAESPP